MKKSNLFLVVTGLVIITGMYLTNVILKKEYQKIDLTDPYKNYVSVASASYSVLDISGSNGYPIKIIHKKINDIKVLRSRLNHFKSKIKNDTLFILFTGSNISMYQAFSSETPSGVIIESNDVSSIIATNTYNRIIGFSNQDLEVTLKGNSLMRFFDCNLKTMHINSTESSQYEFSTNNKVDSLYIEMSGESVGYFQDINFSTINHSLKDSIRVVFSRGTFERVLK